MRTRAKKIGTNSSRRFLAFIFLALLTGGIFLSTGTAAYAGEVNMKSSNTGENLEYTAVAFVSQTYGIPIEQLAVANETITVATYQVTERRFWCAKVLDMRPLDVLGDNKSIYPVYIDENGNITDNIKAIEAGEKEAAFSKYGKLEPALFEFLKSKEPDENIKVFIWLNSAHELPVWSGKQGNEAEIAEYWGALDTAYTSPRAYVAGFLNANGFSIESTFSGGDPLVFVEVPKRAIDALQNMPEVGGIYLVKEVEGPVLASGLPPLEVSLDKTTYRPSTSAPGELMIITIKNVSDNYTYSYAGEYYELFAEKRVGDNWVFYPDMFHSILAYGGIIPPGENVQVRYFAPRDPGDYRIAADRFSVKSNYVEFEVREPTNWSLVAGIVAVVAITGVLVAFYIRRRS